MKRTVFYKLYFLINQYLTVIMSDKQCDTVFNSIVGNPGRVAYTLGSVGKFIAATLLVEFQFCTVKYFPNHFKGLQPVSAY